VSQISFSAFIINKSSNINDILINYKNIDECAHDAIYRLQNGSLIEIALAILISGSIIIGSYIFILINKYIKQNNNYQILDNYNTGIINTGIINTRIINKDVFDMTINIIFVMAIISFIISNGVQFILQLNNISNACLLYINNHVQNFFIIYKFGTCVSFIASYALFFIVPCFI
jgi:hypothetical protein